MNIASSKRSRAGFMLLEAILAVAVFALGVLALGRSVTNCLKAERLQAEDALARRALENRLALIESNAIQLQPQSTEKLSAPFNGMTLTEKSTPLDFKNENDATLAGLLSVDLQVSWQSGGETQSRQLTVYVRSRTP